jgi:5-methylcytosine-specific restriction endonuclease McrA
MIDARRDRRYGSKRWKELRLDVLRRDLHRCWIPSCEAWADVCDHVAPVYPGMPDTEFYNPWNLRASCRRHNTARGVAARLERETAGLTEWTEPRPTWPRPVIFRDRR